MPGYCCMKLKGNEGRERGRSERLSAEGLSITQRRTSRYHLLTSSPSMSVSSNAILSSFARLACSRPERGGHDRQRKRLPLTQINFGLAPRQDSSHTRALMCLIWATSLPATRPHSISQAKSGSGQAPLPLIAEANALPLGVVRGHHH